MLTVLFIGKPKGFFKWFIFQGRFAGLYRRSNDHKTLFLGNLKGLNRFIFQGRLADLQVCRFDDLSLQLPLITLAFHSNQNVLKNSYFIKYLIK